ncbi:MAG: hypothetical protein ACI94O_001162, partial [Octadecabacter sp.]
HVIFTQSITETRSTDVPSFTRALTNIIPMTVLA